MEILFTGTATKKRTVQRRIVYLPDHSDSVCWNDDDGKFIRGNIVIQSPSPLFFKRGADIPITMEEFLAKIFQQSRGSINIITGRKFDQ
jgi:hypothetical protein